MRSIQILALWTSVSLLGAGQLLPAPQAPFDLVIVNGLVVDGTGTPPFRADVGIRQGRIERIGALGAAPARQRIDARGLVVAPGFIDVHTHVEEQIRRTRRRFLADNFLLQGVTTTITGNCGRSYPDVEAFFQKLQGLKLAVNIATLVGHNTIRQQVCGWRSKPPTSRQLQEMESRIAAALDRGAVGFSTGLSYQPGIFAQQNELVALVRVAARRGAVYATHIRDEASGEREALEEAVRTAQAARAAKLHISHFKAAGRSQWGQARARLDWVRQVAGPTLRVTADLYPYTALSSTLDYLIPPEAFRALGGPATNRAKNFQRAIDATLEKLHRNGWEDYSHVRIAFSERHREWIGQSIPEVVRSVGVTSALSLRDQAAWILKHQARGDIQIIAEEMSEQDLRQVITATDMAFGSDSSVHYRGLGRPHPRGSGSFPRVFGEYVRNLNLLALEEAVRRATGLPAEIFDLPDRGLIREGFWADLVLFDPARIRDCATAEDPWRPPEGIAFVIENGVPVVRYGKLTNLLPGQPIRGLRKTLARDHPQAVRMPGR